jgi:hypothetical protein
MKYRFRSLSCDNPSLVPILSHINPAHIDRTYFSIVVLTISESKNREKTVDFISRGNAKAS